ncbi:hypothetical protein FOA52_000332 [Chlamydomonas sp. UWO 241]|nr:hypothetical protein FOA52_000332 [Chlamydomonas sp. UWO 241]
MAVDDNGLVQKMEEGSAHTRWWEAVGARRVNDTIDDAAEAGGGNGAFHIDGGQDSIPAERREWLLATVGLSAQAALRARAAVAAAVARVRGREPADGGGAAAAAMPAAAAPAAAAPAAPAAVPTSASAATAAATGGRARRREAIDAAAATAATAAAAAAAASPARAAPAVEIQSQDQDRDQDQDQQLGRKIASQEYPDVNVNLNLNLHMNMNFQQRMMGPLMAVTASPAASAAGSVAMTNVEGQQQQQQQQQKQQKQRVPLPTAAAAPAAAGAGADADAAAAADAAADTGAAVLLNKGSQEGQPRMQGQIAATVRAAVSAAAAAAAAPAGDASTPVLPSMEGQMERWKQQQQQQQQGPTTAYDRTSTAPSGAAVPLNVETQQGQRGQQQQQQQTAVAAPAATAPFGADVAPNVKTQDGQPEQQQQQQHIESQSQEEQQQSQDVDSQDEQEQNIESQQFMFLLPRLSTGNEDRPEPSLYAQQEQLRQIEAVVGLPVPKSESLAAALWNLDRADQRDPPLDGTYRFGSNLTPGTGAGVTIYVIDSGIYKEHQEFRKWEGDGQESRASYGYDFITNQDGSAVDCDGHGTHVSSTAVGRSVGVAKQANIVSLRILDCEGSGTISDTIAALEWVATRGVRPAVALMSLGVPKVSARV